MTAPDDMKTTLGLQTPRACAAVALAALILLPVPAEASYRDRQSVRQAEVVSVNPLFESFEVREPREQCRAVPVRERSRVAYDGVGYGDDRRRYSGERSHRSRTPTVVGAILGGAIGHSVGNGKKNKKIGTAVGAILGGTIGGDISRRNHERRNQDRVRHEHGNVRYRTERVCEVVSEVRTEERISGYDVAYTYGGETYNTVLDYDPGRYLEVSVLVTPIP